MPDQTGQFDKVTQKTLDDIVQKHTLFNIGKRGGGRAVLKFKDLSGLNFYSADLSGADFTGSNLSNANLARGKFNGTVFYGCNMTGANLEGGEFGRTDFRGADLTDANMASTDLRSADLRQGKFDVIEKKKKPEESSFVLQAPQEKNDIYESNYSSSALEEEIRHSDLILKAEEIAPRDSDLVLDNDKKDDSYESELVLGGTDESRTSNLNLIADTEEGQLRHSLASHAAWLQFSGAKGKKLEVFQMNFRSIPDLGRFPMIMAKLGDCDFSGMFLENSQMQGAFFDGSNFTAASLAQADMRGSSLKSTNFGQANLSRANLDPLLLPNDRLLQVDLSDANLKDVNFQHAKLRKVILIGAKLNGADFQNADLRGADLSGCDLSTANFENARLDGAILPDKA